MKEAATQIGIYALYFLLGPLVECAVEMFKSRNRMWRPQISVSGVGLGLLFVVCAILFRIPSMSVDQGASGTSVASADPLTYFGLVLGAIGLIVTALTGLSITAAWRALDEASRARDSVLELLGKIDLDYQRTRAYVESVDRTNQVRGLESRRLEFMRRTELSGILSQSDAGGVIRRLWSCRSNSDLIMELGPHAQEYLNALSKSAILDEALQSQAAQLLGESRGMTFVKKRSLSRLSRGYAE